MLVVKAQRGEREVSLRVADNGPGVPPRARENLFQAFRGSVSPGGTGLGLAIAAELVRLHGGMIALEPSPMGAVFKVTLPTTRQNGN
jgi:signal transduction histidine kinase